MSSTAATQQSQPDTMTISVPDQLYTALYRQAVLARQPVEQYMSSLLQTAAAAKGGLSFEYPTEVTIEVPQGIQRELRALGFPKNIPSDQVALSILGDQLQLQQGKGISRP
jgi:hypothetical protein